MRHQMSNRFMSNGHMSCFFTKTFTLSLSYSSWLSQCIDIGCIHYQKIDKYKRKYRGNIFVGKFPRDFTDGNIPSVYTDGITVGKKFKTKQKKR